MKLLFSNEWLRRKIASDPDTDPEAGRSLVPSVESRVAQENEPQDENLAMLNDRNATQLRISLGIFVHQLRLREGLSIGELAKAAEISEEELLHVERNPQYTASARLIYKLSEHFNVELKLLSQLSGITRAVDRKFFNAAVGYAAKSEGMSTLTSKQQDVLDSFIELLNEHSVPST